MVNMISVFNVIQRNSELGNSSLKSKIESLSSSVFSGKKIYHRFLENAAEFSEVESSPKIPSS